MKTARQKNNQKAWKTFKTGLKWIIVMILLAWLLMLLKDFYDHNQLLIRLNTEQNATIESLQSQLDTANSTNGALTEQLQLEHQKVEALQHQLKVTINNEPVIMTETDLKNEVEPQLKEPAPEKEQKSFSWESVTIPTAIVGGLTLLRTLIQFVPVIP